MRPSILIATMFQLTGLAFPPALAEGTAPNPPLVQSYLESAGVRRVAVEGAEMEVEIIARLPKLQKAAALRALRRVSCDGRVTYQALDFSGDARVKREVIARYLAAETEARDASSVAITPANYEFRLKAALGTEGRSVQVFRLKPRKKRVGLFKGELWLDAETGMPLRESGQFVKVPSIFLKRIRFVRDYEIRDGVSIPKSIESTVETRLAGRAELSVHFRDLADTASAGCGCEEQHFDTASQSRGRR